MKREFCGISGPAGAARGRFGRSCLLLVMVLVFSLCAPAAAPGGGGLAFAAGELRGVWVPTVLSLNYPSQK
ncbi:MAG: hypothetical protein LBG71_01145, partial [Clostridiales Family XIII bacterium]|nr:hypothetical protein [Clostridiales Family XIII bacterium]